jgi:uncharacterized protein YkwD
MVSSTSRLLLGASILVFATAIRADPASVVNALRIEGCNGHAAIGTALQPDATLDDVARALYRKYSLEEALRRSGYRAERSTSFHLGGSRDDEPIREILAERYCESVNNPGYEHVGVYGRGDETWIVLAARLPPPPSLDPAAVAQTVLTLTNEARAEARRCGRERFEPASPLMLSETLNLAADGHVRDMAARGAASHEGSDGSNSGDRIRRAGYAWRASGENVAAGQPDADAVVAAWLESPGHCATLMTPQFTEMGIAFALAPSKDPNIYWTQVFATPLNTTD